MSARHGAASAGAKQKTGPQRTTASTCHLCRLQQLACRSRQSCLVSNLSLQCDMPAGPPGSELPELEQAAGAAAEQKVDGAGRAFLGDLAFAEGSGRVGAPADENAPPGALEVELCAEAAGLAGSGCAALAAIRQQACRTFTPHSEAGRARQLINSLMQLPCQMTECFALRFISC